MAYTFRQYTSIFVLLNSGCAQNWCKGDVAQKVLQYVSVLNTIILAFFLNLSAYYTLLALNVFALNNIKLNFEQNS